MESMSFETQAGWVKPGRKRSLTELKVLIAQKRAELSALEEEAFNLEQGPRLEALVQIRNIMRAHEITIDEVQSR